MVGMRPKDACLPARGAMRRKRSVKEVLGVAWLTAHENKS